MKLGQLNCPALSISMERAKCRQPFSPFGGHQNFLWEELPLLTTKVVKGDRPLKTDTQI